MNVVLNAVAVGLSLVFLSIPVLNRFVFHTVNIDEIIVQGRESLSKIKNLQADQEFAAAMDSCHALIGRFRNDSLTFFSADITDWHAVRTVIVGEKEHPWAFLIEEDYDEEDVQEILDAEGAVLSYPHRQQFLKALNYYVDQPDFYSANQAKFSLEEHDRIRQRLEDLVSAGVYARSGGVVQVKEELSPEQARLVKRFHLVLIEELVFPEMVHKDLRRGKDWASEYIVQTAMYFVGVSQHALRQLDEAIETWNRLIQLYPRSIYAEALFLQIGQALYSEGMRLRANGEMEAAEKAFEEAVSYLKMLEQNREIAREFPKYKYADLKPGKYVNVDLASRAKRRTRQKTQIYTTEKAKEELSGETEDTQSGYVLEDAVRMMGECFIEMGETDSARGQFRILLEFFPESDNLDNAQELLADSYVKDGDLVVAAADTVTAQVKEAAKEHYRLAIKEYLKFINVYPQSDLISETFIALGDVYNKIGESDKAGDAFASALGRAKEAEGQAKVQLKIGNYYYDRDRYKEAMNAYQVILTNFLSTEVAPNAQYMLGECHEAMGDTTKAIKNYEVILEHYKRSSFLGGAAFKIGTYYMDRSNYKEARRAYNIGYTYDPEGNLAARSKFQMGMIWKRIAQGQEGEAKNKALRTAIDEFKEVVKGYKGQEADQASYQMAECYVLMGKEKAAREVVKKIENRDLYVKTIKLFGVGANDAGEEAKYWQQVYDDATEDEERATALYEKAQVLANKLSKYGEAVEAYKEILELTGKTSKQINAKIGLAKAYVNLERYDEAQTLYQELLDHRKVNEQLKQQLRIQLCDALLKAGKKQKAYEGFEKFALENPEHALTPYAYYRLGTILADQEKHKEAMEKHQIVLDEYPASDMVDKATLAIGEQMVALGQHREAVEYLENFVEEHPDASAAPNIYLRIGDVYAEHLEKPKAAIKAYATIVEGPKEHQLFSYAAYKQGLVFKDLERDDEALEAFGLVKRENKSIYRAAQAEMGKIIAKTDPERAVENYERIVAESETPEDSAIAMIGIGDVYHGVKKWDKAAETYKKVYELYSGNDTSLIAAAIVKWADALINGKNYNDAITAARLMQERFPDHKLTINTYYFESSALLAQSKYSAARKVLRKIAELDRSKQLTELAYYQIADSYYFGKNPKAAVSHYNEYIKKYPKGKYVARALYMQGNCYFTLKDFQRAKNKFAQVVANHPNFEEICQAKNSLAFALNELGDYRKALKYYDQVIKSGRCDREAVKTAKKRSQDIIVERG